MSIQKSDPLVSAIVPVYNGERYIAETIESILAQTYAKLECIVIDDGSTDETRSICEGFGDRIRYIHKPNGGVSSARNRGIEEARGEFIAFLDADDKWFPDKIARQVAALLESDASLCLTGVVFIDGTGNEIGRNGVPDPDQVVKNILTLSSNTGFIATTGLARKDSLNRVGLFDEKLSTAADADMVLRFALRSKIFSLDEPLAMYRHHTGQMHHNLAVFEPDMNITFNKFFSSNELPERYGVLRRKAKANFEASLFIGKLRQRQMLPALRHILRSVSYSPLHAFSYLGRVVRVKLTGNRPFD